MTEVNWDDVLQEADDSPRSILAECLARVDEITELVVIFHDDKGGQHEYCCVSSQALMIGMLEVSKFSVVQAINEAT